MIFEIDEIPEGGLSFNLFVKKEQLQIDQPECYLAENVKITGKLKPVSYTHLTLTTKA